MRDVEHKSLIAGQVLKLKALDLQHRPIQIVRWSEPLQVDRSGGRD
jgi:hypothetical protein